MGQLEMEAEKLATRLFAGGGKKKKKRITVFSAEGFRSKPQDEHTLGNTLSPKLCSQILQKKSYAARATEYTPQHV